MPRLSTPMIPQITVRPVCKSDGFIEDPYSGEFVDGDGKAIYAVFEFGYHLVIPFTEFYVDFYGDGGNSPEDAFGFLLYRALGGKNASR